MTISKTEKTPLKRVERLLKLAELKQNFGISINDIENMNKLAERWRVSVRTIRRDIKDIDKIYTDLNLT